MGMKKLILCLCLFFPTGFLLVRGEEPGLPEKERILNYYYQGLEMFGQRNYAGATDMLVYYKKYGKDASRLQEADYLIGVSAFERNDPETVNLLDRFIQAYPWSDRVRQAILLTGDYYFFHEEYARAITRYNRLEMDEVPAALQADYCYRLGLSYLKTDRLDRAYPYFSALTAIGDRYADAALFYMSYISYAEQDYDRALAGFRRLQPNPEFAGEAAYYMTQIYFIKGEYEKAIASGLKLLDSRPEHESSAEILRIVGESYYRTGNDKAAVKYLSEYVEQESKPLRSALYSLGVIRYRQGEYGPAIGLLSRATGEEDALMQNAYLYLGQAYLKTGDKKNARLAFEMASRDDFDRQVQETAWYNYALLIHETSFSPFNESVIAFEDFLNTFPGSRYTDEINDYLTEVYLTTRNYRAALESIGKIRRPSPKIMKAKQRLLFQLGTELMADSRPEEAKKFFTQAIGAGDYDREAKALAYFWKGECEYRSENYPQAARDYRTYLSAASRKDRETWPLALYNLAYTYFKLQDFPSARQYFSRYTETEFPKEKRMLADAYNRLGDTYFYQRNFEQARTAYAKAASLVPEKGDYALFQQAFVAGLQKDYGEKIRLMDRLIAEYPESELGDVALFEQGRTYVLLEKPGEAITVFNRMLKKYPQSPLTRKAGVQLGLVYFNENKLDDAIAAYKQVIADYPGSEEAKVAAEDLKAVYLEKNDIGSYAHYIQTLGGAVRFAAGEQDSLTYLAAEKVYMRSDYPQAEKSLLGYLSEFPQGAFYAQANYYLGMTYLSLKNTHDALRAFQAVLTYPDSKFGEDALARVAEIQMSEKNYQDAYETYKQMGQKATAAENQLAARTGMLRTAALLGLHAETRDAAERLLSDAKLAPALAAEARFEKAGAEMALGHPDRAVEEWKILMKDPRDRYGAEATYLLGQYYYDEGRTDEAEKLMQAFLEKGTPHQYWLARGFILLSDVYRKKGDDFQAKQYLLSLRNNYKSEGDDISDRIESRLEQLEELQDGKNKQDDEKK